MLLIDGVRYDLWTPPSEDEFVRVVEEHAQDVFGEQSIYLDIRHKLKSKSGIVSIPDGYVVVLGQQPCWHIVEVELSSHPLYEHIVPQVSRFINGIKNPATQKDIVSALYQEIDSDEFLRLRLRKAMRAIETYKVLGCKREAEGLSLLFKCGLAGKVLGGVTSFPDRCKRGQ